MAFNQWLKDTVSKTIYFTIAFPSSCFAITTGVITKSASVSSAVEISSVTKTSFYAQNVANNITYYDPSYFISLGY